MTPSTAVSYGLNLHLWVAQWKGEEGARARAKWGWCKIKLITSSYAADLIGERDSVRSLSSPIIRPVRDPSDVQLIRWTLMKLAKQLFFLVGWVRSDIRAGSVCGASGVGEAFLEKREKECKESWKRHQQTQICMKSRMQILSLWMKLFTDWSDAMFKWIFIWTVGKNQ